MRDSNKMKSSRNQCIMQVELIDKLITNNLILGNVCTEFNFGCDKIQRNSNAPCKKCPKVYMSSNAFRCKYLDFYFNMIDDLGRMLCID